MKDQVDETFHEPSGRLKIQFFQPGGKSSRHPCPPVIGKNFSQPLGGYPPKGEIKFELTEPFCPGNLRQGESPGRGGERRRQHPADQAADRFLPLRIKTVFCQFVRHQFHYDRRVRFGEIQVFQKIMQQGPRFGPPGKGKNGERLRLQKRFFGGQGLVVVRQVSGDVFRCGESKVS